MNNFVIEKDLEYEIAFEKQAQFIKRNFREEFEKNKEKESYAF